MKVLLATVFAPFSEPSEYVAPGNLLETGLFHRSFTREQGIFSILDQQYVYPLHLMAENLPARTRVLEYPTQEAFAREVERGDYDFVGISCVAATLSKARRMCQLVRQHAPRSQTVLGGGGVLALDPDQPPPADHVCRGDGVAFLRQLLGAPQAPARLPIMPTFHGANRLLGLPLRGHTFPVVAGLGCHRQCEFCSTSHQFNGEYLPLLSTGEQLFAFMQRVERHERRMGRSHQHLSFLIYDENFLHHRELVQQLRRLNREQLLRGCQYLLFIFSDASILSEYHNDELLELGVDTIWVGVESPTLANYDKVEGVDTRALCRRLSADGFKVFASMIAGLEDHTAALIRRDIQFALSLQTIGVQYMPVNTIPGTTLHARLLQQQMVLDRDLNYFSMSHYNVRHPTLDEPTVLGLISEFYQREQLENGPLVLRFMEHRWRGYQRLRRSDNRYVRARAGVYAQDLRRGLPVLLAGEVLGPSAAVRRRFRDLRRAVQQHLGHGAVRALKLPGLLRAARALLTANAIWADPRAGGLRGVLRQPRQALERTARGRLPWDQPQSIRTDYCGSVDR